MSFIQIIIEDYARKNEFIVNLYGRKIIVILIVWIYWWVSWPNETKIKEWKLITIPFEIANKWEKNRMLNSLNINRLKLFLWLCNQITIKVSIIQHYLDNIFHALFFVKIHIKWKNKSFLNQKIILKVTIGF